MRFQQAILALSLLSAASARAETTLLEFATPMRYVANTANPGLGLTWTADGFDDTGWAIGAYGVGYETATGAADLILTAVPAGTQSVYTRAPFNVADAATVLSLVLGVDYDDGFVAWLNGVEILRSASMPVGPPAWNEGPASRESSNGTVPDCRPFVDVSAVALPLLRDGVNVLALGVWNTDAASSDLVVVPKLVANRAQGLSRGPYLQTATPSAMTVRWRTTLATDSVVRYGNRPDALSAIAMDAAATTEHVVTVTGLTPRTAYYYSVGDATAVFAGGDAEHRFVTPPTVGPPRPLRIWAVGDAGTADANQAAVRDAYARWGQGIDDSVFLMLGDNAYPDGTDGDYQDGVFDVYTRELARVPVWPTFGNHDARSAASATGSGVYYDIFSLPRAAEAGGLASGTEAYYSFDWANVHFVCLDSQDADRAPGGAMLTWLQQDLMTTAQDWVIAYWHHPPYTRGSHDSDAETDLQEVRASFLPILEAFGVDLVLNGHSHSYERSPLLDSHYGMSSTLTPAMVLDPGDGRPDGDGAYLKPVGVAPHAGAVYTVAGSSGKTETGPLDHPAMLVSLEVLGSVAIDINQSRLDLTFLDDAGVARDHYSIFKGPVPPPRPLGLGATTVSATEIDLAWSDLGQDELGYDLERSPDGDTWAPLASVGPDAVVFADTTALPATRYFYRLRAFNAVGSSAESNVADAVTPGCAPPGETFLLKLVKEGVALRAHWQDVAAATGYTVYEGVLPTGPFATPSGAGSVGAIGAVMPWPPAARSYYRVAAESVCGEGPR